MAGVITIHVGRFYCLKDVNTLNIVADVIALADNYCHVLYFVSLFEADVLTSILSIYHMSTCVGRCYCLG